MRRTTHSLQYQALQSLRAHARCRDAVADAEQALDACGDPDRIEAEIQQAAADLEAARAASRAGRPLPRGIGPADELEAELERLRARAARCREQHPPLAAAAADAQDALRESAAAADDSARAALERLHREWLEWRETLRLLYASGLPVAEAAVASRTVPPRPYRTQAEARQAREQSAALDAGVLPVLEVR